MFFNPWRVSASLENFKSKVLYIGGQRLAHSLSRMRIVITMNGDYGASNISNELQQASALSQLGPFLPDVMKYVALANNSFGDIGDAGIDRLRLIHIGF